MTSQHFQHFFMHRNIIFLKIYQRFLTNELWFLSFSFRYDLYRKQNDGFQVKHYLLCYHGNRHEATLFGTNKCQIQILQVIIDQYAKFHAVDSWVSQTFSYMFSRYPWWYFFLCKVLDSAMFQDDYVCQEQSFNFLP